MPICVYTNLYTNLYTQMGMKFQMYILKDIFNHIIELNSRNTITFLFFFW